MNNLATIFFLFPFTVFGLDVSFNSCLKAYSDKETKIQEKECADFANVLSAFKTEGIELSSQCVSGGDVFTKYNCGIYDVALVNSAKVSIEIPGEIPVNLCFKAYKEAETKVAVKKCQDLSSQLENIDSAAISFKTSCFSGSDSFFKYNCGLYDAAMVGKVTLK